MARLNWGRDHDAMLPRIRDIQEVMLREHRIGFGVWGHPKDVALTDSRGEFYQPAHIRGVINDAEFDHLQSVYRGFWYRSLAD